ncbi:hypothetical protein HQO84_21350 [Rhodococcus fascians]|nr:hypothetical protein [Rhodococcus fascians]MBY3998086.1 hypothetical protein [Rhodococcus fascians]MBY4004240.1 hypothetical protein [Rhodococcus fascians]MBY4008898.1 hypothetical protein [Rhodococcus fascians]MBY4019447.1 hypothetical protein [Rhodococcus fascians]
MKVLSMLLAGFVLGYAISDIGPVESLLNGTAEFGSFWSIVNGLTVVAVAACGTAVAVARVSAPNATIVAMAALLVVVFQTVGMVPGMLGHWTAAMGTGVLLGAAAVLSGHHRGAQAALGVSVVGAGLLGYWLDALWQANDGPVFVWDVVGAEDDVVPERAIVMVIAAVAAAVTLFLARHHEVMQPPETPRILLVGLSLPVVASVLSWIAADADTRSVEWLGALVGMTAAALLASFLLPGRDGRLLLMLFAVSATALGTSGFAAGDAVRLCASAALLVVGAGIGYRWPQLYIGLGGLFVIAATSLTENYVDIPIVSQFALPLVAAYVLVSALATSAGSLAISLPALFVMALPVTVVSAGYIPSLSMDQTVATRTSEPDHLVLSVAGLVVLVVVTGAAVLLARRSPVVRGNS